ncbi:MAG: COX15/CtaA family protein [Cyclobacteriaceae bacterium]
MNKVSVFRSINLTTIIAVYLLILVGGLVRTLGAGMGCPDWPKCFGQYTPPSSRSELPENYQEFFTGKRLEKSTRLASVLSAIGFEKAADKILNNPELAEDTPYSFSKAWIEYINRIIGVIIGLLIILNAWWSLKLRKKSTSLAFIGVFAFILVVFQGWVGSLVVATNLLPGFITFHMVLALLLVAMLLVQQVKVRDFKEEITGKWQLLILLGMFFIQIILGTGVREQIDVLVHQGIERGAWIGQLGMGFYIHRSFSILIVLLTGWLIWLNKDKFLKSPMLLALASVIGLEILVGIVLAYLNVPAAAQPAHLLLGSVGFGMIFYLFLSTYLRHRII